MVRVGNQSSGVRCKLACAAGPFDPNATRGPVAQGPCANQGRVGATGLHMGETGAPRRVTRKWLRAPARTDSLAGRGWLSVEGVTLIQPRNCKCDFRG